MSRSTLTSLAILAILGLGFCEGCGSGGGSQASVPAAPAPSGLKAVADPLSSNLIVLSWTAPPAAIDTFWLEARLVRGEFVTINTAPIPPSQCSGYLEFDNSSIPEATDVEFRVRADRTGSPSTYSNTMSYHYGLHVPTRVSLDPTPAGMQLAWSNPSARSDTIFLERGVSGDGGATYSWTPLGLKTPGSSNWLDTSAPDLTPLVYRITLSNGSDRGYETSPAATSPALAPTALTATSLVKGARLAWQNHSSRAAEVVIWRADTIGQKDYFQELAHLNPGTTAFEDLGLGLDGYSYRVESRSPGAISGFSDPVSVMPTPPPLGGATLVPQVVAIPKSVMGRRNAKGDWILADFGDNSGTCQISLPVLGGGWTTTTLPGASALARPWLLLDSKGNPHTVQLGRIGPGDPTQIITHVWHDDSGWQSEEMARRPLLWNAPDLITFDLDPADHLRCIWLNDPNTGTGLEFAYQAEDGTWRTEPLATTPPLSYITGYRLVDDGDGKPIVLLAGSNFSQGVGYCAFLLHRDLPNQWSREPIPIGTFPSTWGGDMNLIVSKPGDTSVFYSRPKDPTDFFSGSDFLQLRKRNGLWSSPETVSPALLSAVGSPSALAASADGSRLALYVHSAAGNVIMLRDQDVWNGVRLWDRYDAPPFLGFDSSGKFYMMHIAGDHLLAAPPYVLYTEFP